MTNRRLQHRLRLDAHCRLHRRTRIAAGELAKLPLFAFSVISVRRISRCHVLAKRGPSTYGSPSLSGLQQQFSDDLAAFEQRLGAAGFGERQAVVDQRADAA